MEKEKKLSTLEKVKQRILREKEEELKKRAKKNDNLRVLAGKIPTTTYNPIYWYPNKLLSYDPEKYFFYIAIGSRGRGKTVSAWRWVLKRFLKHGELFIWLRLTDAPIKKMSKNSSTTLVPPFLLKQLGIEGIYMRGATIYCIVHENGDKVTKMCGIMDSISTFYTTKGNNMELFTNVVFDEINRESSERNTFDVTRAFINQIESIARFRKIRVLMLGNTITDTSDILSIFNFQPTEFGIYKLTRKHTIIEYMDDSEEFKQKRKESLAGVLLGDNEEVNASFINKSKGFRSNIQKYDGYRQLFTFYIDTVVAFGVYERNGHKGSEGASEGLYIGDVRNKDVEVYKISPFLNCEGIYNREIYDSFYELVSVNLLFYETTLVRSRFVRALKNNRTII